MKKFLFLLITSTAFSALPPLAQSTREIQSILADSRFYEALGSAESIREILRTEEGYLILTQTYALKVHVLYDRADTKRIGPAQYHLEFEPPISLRLSA